MEGWSQLLSSREYPVYQRDIASGPFSFRMEVWPADVAGYGDLDELARTRARLSN